MPEVLYESGHVSRARRVTLALLCGALLPAAACWWRWVRHGRAGASLPEVLLGLALAVLMVATALRSRTVYRVEHDGAELRIHRDPGTIDRYDLAGLRATSEPTPGGWSRDPSETLVLGLPGGRTVRYRLPDDADTLGIVADIETAQREPRSGATGVL